MKTWIHSKAGGSGTPISARWGLVLVSLALGTCVCLGADQPQRPGVTFGSGSGSGGGSGGGYGDGLGGGGVGGGFGGQGQPGSGSHDLPPVRVGSGNGAAGGAAGGGGGTIGLAGRDAEHLALLMNPVVRNDLALTPAQESRCRSALVRVGHANAQSMQAAGGMPADPRRGNDPNGHAAWMRSLKQAGQVARAALTEIMSTLTPAQKQRLNEIRVQGPSVLMGPDPEVAAALGLTQEQRQRMKAIVEDHQNQLRGLGPKEPKQVFVRKQERPAAGANGVFRSTYEETEVRLTPEESQEYDRRFSEVVAEQRRLVEGVLTDAQRAKLAQMRGRPLKR